MWKGTGIFTKSLNNLLTVLLKVHLAPKKHKDFQEFVKSLQNKKQNVNPRKITRDKKRNTFRVQEYKRMKYLRKANISNDPNIKDKYQKLVDRCDKRIEFYKKQFAPEVFTYTSHDLKTKMSSITDAEATLCTSWLNSIAPYIPGKTQMSTIAYQLPLVILTNSILTATGYGEAITSENEALSCKDAVFNAFFDISKINKLCDAHGLNFIHHLHILPGAKTVRIIGALRN
ncbi:hypothetical protein K501DRAFT_181170 [Backusella circina FSU 941]|nr:hypothetical protein K501DRAFT_181170 [Backusella circina FSU 941]